jgi:succinyl-CoA synthetase alpha subunit
MGRLYTKLMLEAGTKVVAGVNPGKAGQEVCGLPIYETVEDLLREHPDANASVVFVPNRFAYSAVHDAIKSRKNGYGIKTVVVITEHIPNQDTMKLIHETGGKNVRIIGPNTPGVISPGKAMLGIIPYKHFMAGDIGIMSRSGTLTYEVANSLTRAGYGQSICVGTGGDRFNGMSYVDLLKLYEMDEQTKAIVMIGEIGGTKEEQAAEYISKHVKKPVVAYIAGRTAPSGKTMGHAGAIISMGMGTYESKRRVLERVGVIVVDIPEEIPLKISEFYKRMT